MSDKVDIYKKRHLKVTVIFVILFLYIISYAVLSYFGSYCPTQSGKLRYNAGLSVTDVAQWHPKFIYGHLFRTIDGKTTYCGNIMGFIYAPLVILDQKYIHKTEELGFTEKQSSVN